MTRRGSTLAAVAVTVLVLVLLALSYVGELDRTGRTMGVSIENASRGVLVTAVGPGSPAARAGVVAGDVLVALAERPVPDREELYEAAYAMRRGEPVHLRVWRAGHEVDLTLVPGVAFPWLSFALTALAVLAYLAVAVVTLLRAPSGLQTKLVVAFTAAVAVELALPGQLGPGWYGVESVVVFLLSGLQLSLELHLASSIPRPMAWIERRPWLVRAYYGAGLAVALSVAVPLVGESFGLSLAPWSSAAASALFYDWGLLLWAAAVLAILVVQARLSATAKERTQAILVMLAVAAWALFNLTLEVLAELDAPVPGWLSDSLPLVLLAYPVAIVVAIFRYDLFDLERVVKRSLLLTSLTSVVVVVSVAFTGAASLLLAARFGEATRLVVVALGMLLLGFLIRPLNEWLQEAISRWVFPERVALRQRLVAATAQLPGRGSLAGMGVEVVDQVRELFRPASCSLFVADPGSGLLVRLATSVGESERRFEESVLAAVDSPGIAALGGSGALPTVAAIRRSDPKLADRLAAVGAERVLVLPGSRGPVALLTLGERPREAPYTAEEHSLLTLFANTAARVLDSAVLFEAASTDLLTGLLRPEALTSLLRSEVVRASRYRRPLTLGLIEVDQLAGVRAERGPLVAAALLRSVAAALRTALRTSDELGRARSDQLALFMPETNLEAAELVAGKLCRHVADSAWPSADGAALSVTVSIGLAGLGASGDQRASDLHEVALHHLEEARELGGNRVLPTTGR